MGLESKLMMACQIMLWHLGDIALEVLLVVMEIHPLHQIRLDCTVRILWGLKLKHVMVELKQVSD